MSTRILLACGIFSSVFYVAINIFVPWGFEGYDQTSYTVSELSAIGSPTRALWVPLAIVYILFFALFGWGVLRSVKNNHKLRMVGLLILAYCVVNVYWPPMHPRGMQPTLTDTLHIAWSFFAVCFMMLMMGFAAAAFGKRFGIYTIVTMILLVIFGFLTSLEAPNIPKDLPTPWIGLWERVMIGLFLLWVVMLAVTLLRKNDARVAGEKESTALPILQ
jgi:hypothetical protein